MSNHLQTRKKNKTGEGKSHGEKRRRAEKKTRPGWVGMETLVGKKGRNAEKKTGVQRGKGQTASSAEAKPKLEGTLIPIDNNRLKLWGRWKKKKQKAPKSKKKFLEKKDDEAQKRTGGRSARENPPGDYN